MFFVCAHCVSNLSQLNIMKGFIYVSILLVGSTEDAELIIEMTVTVIFDAFRQQVDGKFAL